MPLGRDRTNFWGFPGFPLSIHTHYLFFFLERVEAAKPHYFVGHCPKLLVQTVTLTGVLALKLSSNCTSFDCQPIDCRNISISLPFNVQSNIRSR